MGTVVTDTDTRNILCQDILSVIVNSKYKLFLLYLCSYYTVKNENNGNE